METLFTFAENKLKNQFGHLADFRQKHLAVFKAEGIKHDSEKYKFTNLQNALNLEIPSISKTLVKEDNVTIDPHYINIVFSNGILKGTEHLVQGLEVLPFSDGFEAYSSQLKVTNPLSHLHHALLGEGICIKVKKKTKIENPIRIQNIVTGSDIQAPTIILHLEEFAEACLIEESSTPESTSNIVIQETYITLDPGSRLEHVQVSLNGQATALHSSTQIKVAKDAHYRNVMLNLSGKLTRRNLNLELTGPSAHGESYALYLTNQNEHCDISTIIEHKCADTTSDQVTKGIMDEESKGIFTGKIHIHPKAQRVSSGQINKNLLLSKKAQAHSQPQLEIFADDVKCSHGSTTGQLSEEEVFYFEARGIPAAKARTLLAHAFGLEIVLKIQNKIILNRIKELVLESLKTKFKLEGIK
jgi:Fe-S cluster assembly protein SufD